MLEPYSDERFIEIYHDKNLNAKEIVKKMRRSFGIKSYNTVLKHAIKIKCGTRKERDIRKYKLGK